MANLRPFSKKSKGGRRLCGGRCCPCRPAFRPRTHCPALVPCSVAGCAILHAPPPCLSTGGRIGCDRRSRFAFPTVCVSAGARRPPPPFQASTPVRVCILPHRPRHDIGARALISPFPLPLTPIPSACRFYVGLPSTLLIPVHVPSLSRVHSTLSSPPSKAPVCHRSRNATRVVALSTRWFCCLPDAVRALLADAAPTARPCDVEAKANGSRDARHIAWCVRLLRVVGAS